MPKQLTKMFSSGYNKYQKVSVLLVCIVQYDWVVPLSDRVYIVFETDLVPMGKVLSRTVHSLWSFSLFKCLGGYLSCFYKLLDA